MNRDSDNIIGQIQPDGSIEGGDSACWMGHWLYLSREKFPYTSVFSTGFGAFVRHPEKERTNNGFGAYYSHPWDGVISRDQLTGILAGVIAEKKRWMALKIILHHACWLWLFSYNTRKNGADPKKTAWKWPDLTGPDMWALEIRALGSISWLLWPVLLVLDLYIVLATIFDFFHDSKDPINFVIRLIIGVEHTPTLFSLLAFKIANKDKLILELNDYWCGWRDGCDIVPLYIGKLRK